MSSQTGTASPVSRYLPWGAAALFFVASVTNALFFAVLSPSFAKELNLDQSQLGLLSGVYFAVYAIGQLVLGSLLGPIRLRLILGSAAIMTAIGSFLFASSTSLSMAVIAQILMGFGLSSSFVGVVYVIGRDLPHRFSFMTSLSQALSNIAGASVAILACVTSLFAAFRGPFYFATGLFLVAAVALVLFVGGRDTSQPQAVEAGPAMALPAILLACVRSVQFWAALVFYSCLFGTIIAYSGLWNMQFQINFFRHSLQDSSLLNAMIPLGITGGSLVAGIWAQRRKDFVLPAQTFGLLSVIVMTVMWLFDLGKEWALVSNFVLGFSLSGSILALSVVPAHLPKPAQALGAALIVTAAFVTGGFIQPVVGLLVEVHVQGAALYGFARDIAEAFGRTVIENEEFGTYQRGYGVFGGFILLGFLSSLLLRRAKPT